MNREIVRLLTAYTVCLMQEHRKKRLTFAVMKCQGMKNTHYYLLLEIISKVLFGIFLLLEETIRKTLTLFYINYIAYMV